MDRWCVCDFTPGNGTKWDSLWPQMTWMYLSQICWHEEGHLSRKETIIPERLHALRGRGHGDNRPLSPSPCLVLLCGFECQNSNKLTVISLFLHTHIWSENSNALSSRKAEPFTHVKVSSELFLFFFFYWHVPFSVGFFTSERTPRPVWWPQTLSEVKWNSQSSQLWKIPIVQNKMFDYVCVLLHRKMRTIPKNWSESNQRVTKMRYTAWQNTLWGRLKSTGSSRQSPALQNKSKHDFSWKKIWLFRPTNKQARGKTNWGWK